MGISVLLMIVGTFNVLQTLFSFLQKASLCDCADLITEIADTYMSLEHFDCALKFYQMLDGNLENSVRKTGPFFSSLFDKSITECF